MKKAITALGLLTLLFTLAMLIHQCGAKQAPSVQLIQDMYATPSRPRTAPPAGSLPYGEVAISEDSAPTLFTNHCATCHGNTGDGHSYVSAYPGMPGVGNLTTTAKSAPELNHSIFHGRGAMPAFQNRLNEAEISTLTNYIINHIRNK